MTCQAPRAAPRRRSAPARRRRGQIWLATAPVIGLSAWLVTFYLRATAGWSVPAATPLGRWYGGMGAGLMLVLALYSARHAAYRRRFGSLELWYRTHLWLGVLALALLGAHCGFRCRGLFLTLMQVFFWGAMVTGLLGWLLQTWVKRALLRHEDRPLVMKQIVKERDAVIEVVTQRVEVAIPGLGERNDPEGAARREVQAALGAVRAIRRRNLWRFPSPGTWKKLVQYHGRPILAHRLDSLAPAESAVILEEIARINQLEVSASYHRWMRGWTTFHLALTLGLAQLILWHIYTTCAW
jgi:hypothetical protein